MKETKCSQMTEIMKTCKNKMSQIAGKTVRLSSIDICLCSGYFIMYYENNDICISMEISCFDGEFILTNTGITEN